MFDSKSGRASALSGRNKLKQVEVLKQVLKQVEVFSARTADYY